MGEEELVARFELLAESTHNRAEEARLKWMEARQLAAVLEKQLENSKQEEADQAKIVDEKIQMKKTNAAAVVNDHGKLYAARKALAAKPDDLTLKAIVQRLEAAEVARGTIEKHDEEDQASAQKEEQKTLAQVHGREDQLAEQKKKVEALKVQFGVWNKKAQQAAQDAAEARAKYKIKHTIKDLVEREKVQNIEKESGKGNSVDKKDEPSAVQKELMKIGTTFSDAVNWRVGGSAGIPVPMHAPQTVTKEQMGAAVGAAIGAQRGAEIGAVKGAGDAALTMSNAGTSFLQMGAKKTFGEEMADKALAIAREEQEAAHRAFVGEDVNPPTWKERVSIADAKEDAESNEMPRFRALSETYANQNAHGLLRASVASEINSNKALRRYEVLRHHAQRLWSSTNAAKDAPSSLKESSKAISAESDRAAKNVLFRGMPHIDAVQDPLFTETASWLKSQKLPNDMQQPSQLPVAPMKQILPGLPRFQGMATLADRSYASEAMKVDLDSPLPDLNEFN